MVVTVFNAKPHSAANPIVDPRVTPMLSIASANNRPLRNTQSTVPPTRIKTSGKKRARSRFMNSSRATLVTKYPAKRYSPFGKG